VVGVAILVLPCCQNLLNEQYKENMPNLRSFNYLVRKVPYMVKKQCPRCNQNSYSSSDRESWICPYCGLDLRDVEAVVAGAKD